MSIETIYNELKEINKELENLYIKELLAKMEKEIRKNASYKENGKTRNNAIIKVASKSDIRPVLQGYGILGEYKGVTDSYHAILIKQETMPLKLVATSSDFEKYDFTEEEYKEKYGEDSIITATYPDLTKYISINYDKSNELKLDLTDLLAFIKMNKKEKSPLYRLGECLYNAKFIKNIIDIIGKDCKIYFQGEYRPLYFVNDKEEIGIVLPVKTY